MISVLRVISDGRSAWKSSFLLVDIWVRREQTWETTALVNGWRYAQARHQHGVLDGGSLVFASCT